MTNVKFLFEKNDGLPSYVFAFFPELKDNNKSHTMFTCYAHIGQHSACHIDYANACKEAKYNQFADLLVELIGQGYKDLFVLNSQVIQLHRQPTKGEIKFGYGATHYRDFLIGEVINNKSGKFKKWIKASNDGLRYYR